MSIREESNSSQPKIRRAFNIEEVHDLRRGNSIHQLQTAVKSLSNEITNVITRLDEVLARFKDITQLLPIPLHPKMNIHLEEEGGHVGPMRTI